MGPHSSAVGVQERELLGSQASKRSWSFEMGYRGRGKLGQASTPRRVFQAEANA